jgi:hypothetical protein
VAHRVKCALRSRAITVRTMFLSSEHCPVAHRILGVCWGGSSPRCGERMNRLHKTTMATVTQFPRREQAKRENRFLAAWAAGTTAMVPRTTAEHPIPTNLKALINEASSVSRQGAAKSLGSSPHLTRPRDPRIAQGAPPHVTKDPVEVGAAGLALYG